MKKAVYTCIIGNYDPLKPIINRISGWDYICFTDDPRLLLNTQGWEIRVIEKTMENVRQARHVKIMTHEYLPDYDLTIWVDGKIQLKTNPDILIKKFGSTFTTLKHKKRTNIFQEAIVIIKSGKDKDAIVTKQTKKYKHEGLPSTAGLANTCFMIRSNAKEVRDTMQLWWNEIITHSHRDQLSFPYACWKTGFKPRYIDNDEIRYRHGKQYKHNRRNFIK